MTRKDYEIIAKAMRIIKPQGTLGTPGPAHEWLKACGAIADVCFHDNPQFNRRLFLAACGADVR